MTDKTIQITPDTFRSLASQLDDLDRYMGALRAFSGGLHYAVENHQVNGEELETLIVLVEERLSGQLGRINEQFLSLRKGA